jgi:hypothetical protein
MRSKIAKKILSETPQDLKDFVKKYADKLVLSRVVKSFYCIDNDIWNKDKCKEQCDRCKKYIKSFEQ